jgi:ABC-2 type transport system ATP-binding protein
MTDPMIHTEKLTRHFVSKKETVEAVKGVDIDVAPGELVAFLGPNGAGKSTTLRMLTTLLPPTSGNAWVAGASITTQAAVVRSRIGYIGQGDGAGHSFRVMDELVYQGRFYGMNSADSLARAKELTKTLDLTSLAKRKVSTLSGGQRRRLDIALGLMHSPRLLFLDEPSTGMDPHNRANLWDHINGLRERQETTIVLTTHYLEEAQQRADRIGLMHQGVFRRQGTVSELTRALPSHIRFAVADGSALPLPSSVDGNTVVVETFELQKDLHLLLGWAQDNGVELRDLSAGPTSLDDVFRAIEA